MIFDRAKACATRLPLDKQKQAFNFAVIEGYDGHTARPHQSGSLSRSGSGSQKLARNPTA
jgi:hypothetical protein